MMRFDKRHVFGGISVLVLCLAVAGSLYVALAGDTGTVAAKSSTANRTVGGAAGAPAAVNAASATGGAAFVSSAAAAAPGADPYVWQYSGEFLCGQIPAAGGGPLGPGIYNTDIAIHNPSNVPTVWVQKKVVVLPPAETIGTPSLRRYFGMGPDTGFEVDCNDITSFAYPAGQVNPCTTQPFCKGYLVVEAAKPLTGALQTGLFPAELDLNATITVTNTAGEVHAMTTTNHFFAHLVAYPCWVADPTQVLCP